MSKPGFNDSPWSLGDEGEPKYPYRVRKWITFLRKTESEKEKAERRKRKKN